MSAHQHATMVISIRCVMQRISSTSARAVLRPSVCATACRPEIKCQALQLKVRTALSHAITCCAATAAIEVEQHGCNGRPFWSGTRVRSAPRCLTCRTSLSSVLLASMEMSPEHMSTRSCKTWNCERVKQKRSARPECQSVRHISNALRRTLDGASMPFRSSRH